MTTLNSIEEALTQECQRVNRVIMRKEAVHLAGPTRALSDELKELGGYLKGLKEALSIVAAMRGGNELPLGEAK